MKKEKEYKITKHTMIIIFLHLGHDIETANELADKAIDVLEEYESLAREIIKEDREKGLIK